MFHLVHHHCHSSPALQKPAIELQRITECISLLLTTHFRLKLRVDICVLICYVPFFFFVRSGGLYRWELRRKLFFASLNPNCLYHTLELDTITELSFSRWGLKSTKGDSGVPTDLTSYKHIMPSTQSTLPGKKSFTLEQIFSLEHFTILHLLDLWINSWRSRILWENLNILRKLKWSDGWFLI